MINCQGCERLRVNNYTCRHYCQDTGSFCKVLRTSDISSPIVPENGECPGFVNPWDIKAGLEIRPGVYVK